MQKLILTVLLIGIGVQLHAQKKPCSGPAYRQFDFWIGEWEAFGLNGSKAGDSKISVLLDSCVIFEEWTGAGQQGGLKFAGKSFNTFNRSTGQWQQTWVDNAGGSNEYLLGKFEGNKIVFSSKPFAFKKDSMALRRMTFFNLGPDRVRQLGEISKNDGTTWITEYDLDYRRKKKG